MLAVVVIKSFAVSIGFGKMFMLTALSRNGKKRQTPIITKKDWVKVTAIFALVSSWAFDKRSMLLVAKEISTGSVIIVVFEVSIVVFKLDVEP